MTEGMDAKKEISRRAFEERKKIEPENGVEEPEREKKWNQSQSGRNAEEAEEVTVGDGTSENVAEEEEEEEAGAETLDEEPTPNLLKSDDSSDLRNLNKRKFFSSDSEECDTESSGEAESAMERIKGKRTKKLNGEWKSSAGGNSSMKDDEHEKLRRLLSMTNKSFSEEKIDRGSEKAKEMAEEEKMEAEEAKEEEEEEEMVLPKKQTTKKSKKNEEAESLLDFLSDEKHSEMDEEKKKKKKEEEMEEDRVREDFESRINDEVKSAFLLSSSESLSSGEEEKKKEEEEEGEEEKRRPRRDGGKEKNATNGKKTRRKDNFGLLNVSTRSSDSETESRLEIAAGEKDEKEAEESVAAAEEDDDDDDEDDDYEPEEEEESRSDEEEEEENREKRKKSKISYRRSSTEEEPPEVKEVLPEDSQTESTDSDVQQIPIVKFSEEESPAKGRRNIKKILKRESLEVGTKQARKMEAERKKRLAERKGKFEEIRSERSKLILDFDPETAEELLTVDESLSRRLKPHQREGVKFMWDNCFESLRRMEEDGGSGCILAHCMGLGKTLQVITLVHTLLTTRSTGVKSVMIMCPVNTIRNWAREFKFWMRNCRRKIVPIEIRSIKGKRERVERIVSWEKNGGVLIIGYNAFRSMLDRARPEYRRAVPALSDPGPDLVVCDEGHLLKNENSALSRSISQIKTLRRIVLTGTPLQNNLIEYYCMVQFVKPNILGTKKEFMNGFVNPIKNGQFEDSTSMDVVIMKRRAHVLHSLLEGFIQRRGYYVLTPFLPEKQEYVISISLTETQDRLYRTFVSKCSRVSDQSSGGKSEGLFNDYHWLQKVWTHPLVMLKAAENRSNDPEAKPSRPERMKESWGRMVRAEEYEDVRSGGKLWLLFKILKGCRRIGDKILVFSQYISSLNLIEHFLSVANKNREMNRPSEFAENWILGQDYFRMDGSTNSQNRFDFCKKFNDENNLRSRLFLISTRAGGLGINLVAANRVVIFDASWNPSHDVQSIFRVYRFGQKKTCYIYRFLAEATMEEKIYKRQVTKLSLAHRILDEHQIERHYSMMNLQELYSYRPTPKSLRKVPNLPKDNLFAEILASSRDVIVKFHEHDSLLENKEEEELTEEERRAAWEDFEKERLLESPKTNLFKTVNQTWNPYAEEMDRNALEEDLAVASAGRENLILNQSQDQMCRIVDVRTLNSHRGMHDGDAVVAASRPDAGLWPTGTTEGPITLS